MAKKKSSPTVAPMMDKDYQAEDDHRTLTRAQEICGDRSRMANVRRHHQKMTRALAKTGSMLKGGR